MKMMITTSDFKNGKKCAKRVWFKKHGVKGEESTNPDRKSEEAKEVKLLAENLFEPATEVPELEVKSQMAEYTKMAIDRGDKVIMGAVISSDDLYCHIDYLENSEEGITINIVKAKSNVKVKNGVDYKSEILDDLTFKYYVLTKAGYNVIKVKFIYLNSEYVLEKELDYNSLFKIDDLTKCVINHVDSIEDDINTLIECVEQEDEPGDAICDDCRGECEMADRCWGTIPSPNVWDLNGSYNRKRDKFYKDGLVSFEDLRSAGVLSEKGKIQVETELSGKAHINKEEIKKFLGGIHFPLCFLDFETINKAVPEFEGQKPYEVIPFQYSLHVMREPGGELEHFEYLGDGETDPRREIAERLTAEISDDSCVTAYNMSYEKDRLKEMAAIFPDLAEKLLDIRDNMVDFIVPFQKYHYMAKGMQGKSSLKYVLPALYPDDPELDYKNLPGPQDGDEASDTYSRLKYMDPEEKEKQRENLLKYCELDTYALIKVYEKLVECVK